MAKITSISGAYFLANLCLILYLLAKICFIGARF